VSEAEARKRELEARNAGLRSQIDSMLSDLQRRTAELREKREEAAERTTEVTSQDGMVTVKVDAVGTLQELTLAPKAFERNTPERLARTITSVIREATGGAQQSLQEAFGPITEAGPDIADVVPGAPSFKDLFGDLGPLVTPPDPAAERARQTGAPPPPPPPPPPSAPRPSAPGPSRPAAPQSRPSPKPARGSDRFDDEPPDSFLTGGKW
jgi:DNA-binding protein YbaB